MTTAGSMAQEDSVQPVFDEAWLYGCVKTCERFDGEISYAWLHDLSADTHWFTTRAHWLATSTCQRLEQHFLSLRKLDPRCAILPAAFIRTEDGPVILFPDQKLSSLEALVGQGPLDLASFLTTVRAVTSSIVRVHAADLIHCQLQPEAVVLDADGQARLRNFGYPNLYKTGSLPALTHKEWPYIAPEQVRLTHPTVDVQSDLYSLGVVFYQLATGKLPLDAVDPPGWLHAHLAVQPVPPDTVNPAIPEIVTLLIMKLIAKDPASRYQTAQALLNDLDHCAAQLEASGTLKVFSLGKSDKATLLNQIRQLVGRVSEAFTLRQAYTRVSTKGRSELVVLRGAPGIGKTALVEHFVLQLGKQVTYFAAGKSDQLKSDIPFAPLAQALRSLALQLMASGQDQLQSVCARLTERIDRDAQVILNMVPEMEGVLGRGSSLNDLPHNQAVQRANRALREVLEAFGEPGRPLVIFLDDIQWADESTMAMLQSILSAPPRHVLLIVAYREHEATHLETAGGFIHNTRSSMTPVTELHIEPLPIDAVAEFIVALLGDRPSGLMSIAQAIHAKTGGNPFFVNQIIRNMIDIGVLDVNAQSGDWQCDLSRLSRHPYTDNVVDLVVTRLARLPNRQRELIRQLSLIGRRGDIDFLCSVTTMDAGALMSVADSLIEAGLLLKDSTALFFPHDRLLEAAYELTPAAERPDQHARIARLMINRSSSSAEHLYEVANQILRACRTGQAQDEEPAPFVKALLDAARGAKATAAIDQALEYLDTSRTCLGADGWRTHYSLMYEVLLLSCECNLLTGDLVAANLDTQLLLQHTVEKLHRGTAYRLEATLRTLHSDYEGAISAALAGLDVMGLPLKRNPSEEELEQADATVRNALVAHHRFSPEAIPRSEDPDVECAMNLLSTLAAAFFVDDGIAFLHLAKMVELTLQHGAAQSSGYGFAWYGVNIAHRYDRYAEGLEFALMGLALVDRHEHERSRTAVLLGIDQVSPWTRPFDYALQHARAAITSGHVNGDIGMGCYACVHLIGDLLVKGENLLTVSDEITRYMPVVQQFQYADIERAITAQRNFTLQMINGRTSTAVEHSKEELYASFAILDQQKVSRPTLFWIQLYAGMSALFFGDKTYANRCFDNARPLAWAIPAHINLSDFYLYSALSVSYAEELSVEQRVLRVRESHDRLALWAELNPDTFLSKRLLTQAELARLGGDKLEALRCYDQSAITAATHGFTHEKALAHELAALHCDVCGLVSGARHHWRAARDAYRLWGASGKVKQLEDRFVFLAGTTMHEYTSLSTKQSELDLAIGIKAARVFSEQKLPEEILESLVTHLLVHGGADNGALLLTSDGALEVVAIARVEGAEVVVRLGSELSTDERLPVTVLNSSWRTGKPLILEDVQHTCPEAIRAELDERSARSVLCLPILKQGVQKGLLYLENCQIPGVFNAARLSMLEILSSQAFISLETVQLYEQLLEENNARAAMEAELRISRAELAKSSNLAVMGELSASIAHEISQPLLAIVSNASAGLLWLQRETPDIDEVIVGLEDIRTDGVRAANIVQALRSLAKQAPVNREPVVVDDMVREVLRLTSTEIEMHHIQLVSSLNSEAAKVAADPVQLQQVIYNLVTNAIESLAGTAREHKQLEIASSVEHGTLYVNVIDNGDGAGDDILAQIFDPLYTTKGNGMGMGLAICRSIVGAHHGKLSASSRPGEGFEISLSLPLVQPL